MNNTTGVNKTSKFLLKKEIIETDINEYPAIGNYNNVTFTLSLRNDGNKNGYKFSVSFEEIKTVIDLYESKEVKHFDFEDLFNCRYDYCMWIYIQMRNCFVEKIFFIWK